jgi:RNA polymerase sigma factor (sigma-70 family)
MNAIELWTDFREDRSEAAFGELVRRYTSLVFSVARRRLPDSDLAKDATQQVFIRLARARPDLRIDAELVAWLHRTTLHVSIDLWRTETRRRNREQKAFAMPTSNDATVPWSELAPELDQALDALSDADRQAVLLRFFERMSMRELGEAVGVSEDAAKMRVSRALERLRGLLGERG